MTTGRGRTPGVMRSWVHATLWLIMLLAGTVLLIAAVSTLSSAAVGGRPEPGDTLALVGSPRNAAYLAGTALFLVALLAVWSRYWFLPSDLIGLVEAEHGSTVDRHGRIRTCIRARVRDLWVFADLDHPVFSYWPSHALRFGDDSPAMRRGLHPRHMHAVSRVELVRVGSVH